MSYKNFKLPSCIIRTSVYITIFGANAKAIKHFFIILISFLIMSILGICFTSTSRQKFLRKTFGFQPKILHGMLRKFSSLIQAWPRRNTPSQPRRQFELFFLILS